MIADASHVRKVVNLPASLADAEILPHLRQAGRRLKSWVDASVYSAAETDASANSYDFTATDPSTADLADAEAYLALGAGLASWNLVMENDGDNAAGIAQRGTIGGDDYEYLNPVHIPRLEASFLAKAEDAARAYLSNQSGGGSPGPKQSHAYDDDGCAIDGDYPENC